MLHVDQRFVSKRPIRVGDVISGIAEIESVRERMGMSWLVIRTDIRTDSGRARREHVLDDPGPRGRGVSAATDDEAPRRWRPPRYADVEVGHELPTLTVRITRADLVRYAGASTDFNTIHWSDRVAHEVGPARA